jgi:serine/threonine protein kinase
VGLPELIGGKYRPRDILGAGATGVVYSVEHAFTGELLALKVMTSHLGGSADAIERFKREARTASRIRSQHVVRIFDADVAPELDGAPYLVMDLLEGVDLEQISGDRPVEPATVVEWLRQVAPPLDKAHRIGIVHRDLKPENLFLTHREDGSVLIKILDFGIAKLGSESTGSTKAGQLLGTPLYMAPEQARAEPEKVGPPSDRYALGLIAYKLLTGAPYWTGTSVAAILAEILYEPLRPPSERHGFGPTFDAWFLRACHHDSVQRFGSAVEQVEALARSLGLPVEIQPRATSTGSLRDSLVTRSEGLPMPSGNGLGSVDPMHPPFDRFDASRGSPPESGGPSDRNDASLAPHGGTVPPPEPELAGGDNSSRRKWRVATVLVALAGLAGLLLVVLGDHSGPPGPVAASRPIALPIEPAVAPADMAVAPPSGAAPSPSAAEATPAPSPGPASDAPKGRALPMAALSKKDPSRSQSARPSPARASPRREKWLFDEAIGDQK